MKLKRVLSLLVILLTACESESSAPEASIEGDWFECLDGCSRLVVRGFRYAADGTMHSLSAQSATRSAAFGPFVDGDPYCVLEPVADYEYGDGVLHYVRYEDANGVTEDFVLDQGGITARNGQLLKVTENPTGVWINGQCELPTSDAQP